MFARLYIEALVVDEALADRIYALWVDGFVTEANAAALWYTLVQVRTDGLPDDPRLLENTRCSD